MPDDDRGPWDPSRDRSPWRSYRTHTYQLHWVYTWGYRMPVYVSEESERRRLDRCEHVAGTFVEEQDRRLEQERARAAAEGTADRMLRELEDARATLRRIEERAVNPARPSDLLASRFCAACEVHWTGGLHCWSCGNEGEIKAQPSCYDGHSPIPYGYGTDPLEDPDIPEVCRTCVQACFTGPSGSPDPHSCERPRRLPLSHQHRQPIPNEATVMRTPAPEIERQGTRLLRALWQMLRSDCDPSQSVEAHSLCRRIEDFYRGWQSYGAALDRFQTAGRDVARQP